MVLDDEKAREPAYFRKSPSWPGMCISSELPLITCAFCYYILICMKFTSNEEIFISYEMQLVQCIDFEHVLCILSR